MQTGDEHGQEDDDSEYCIKRMQRSRGKEYEDMYIYCIDDLLDGLSSTSTDTAAIDMIKDKSIGATANETRQTILFDAIQGQSAEFMTHFHYYIRMKGA